MDNAGERFAAIQEALTDRKNILTVKEMCELAGVSRSGYYNWVRSERARETREQKDRADFERILEAYRFRGYAKGGVSYLIPKLVDMGMELYVTEVGSDGLAMLHEKLMVVDGRYTVIGSSNFNYRTMSLAYEISLVIDSEEFAAASASHFYDRIEEGSFYTDKERAEAIKKEDGSFLSYMMIYYGG